MIAFLSHAEAATDASRSRRNGRCPGLTALLISWAVLLGASVFQDAIGLESEARVWVLDVNAEESLYTWISQLNLALAGLILVDTGCKEMHKHRLFGSQFLFLGSLFFLLSVDEALSIHERATAHLVGVGTLQFGWVIPAAILCVAGFIAAIPFLLRLNGQVRIGMLAAGAVFLLGALGMEAIGGQVFVATGSNEVARSYRLFVNIEEGAEGLGVILFLFALSLHRQKADLEPGISLFR